MGFVIKRDCGLPPPHHSRKYLLLADKGGWDGVYPPGLMLRALLLSLGCQSIRFPMNPSFSYSQSLKGSLNVLYVCITSWRRAPPPPPPPPLPASSVRKELRKTCFPLLFLEVGSVKVQLQNDPDFRNQPSKCLPLMGQLSQGWSVQSLAASPSPRPHLPPPRAIPKSV